MKMRLEYERSNEDANSEVELFISKGISIEDMDIEIDLELTREGIVSRSFKYPLDTINRKSIQALNRYGTNFDMIGFNAKDVADKIINLSNSMKGDFFHKGIGWYNLDKELVFRAEKLIGTKIESTLKKEKFELSRKGDLSYWVEGVNNYIIGNKYLQLMMVVGFSSALINLLNRDNYIGSLVFNLYGGKDVERDIIIRVLNSIWAESNNNSRLINIIDCKKDKIMESIEGNSGVSILIKDNTNTKNNLLIGAINEIQSSNINSAVITGSNQSLLSGNKKDISILVGENISEIDMDIHDVFENKEHLYEIEKLIRDNYGVAGIEFVSYLYSIGIDNVKKDFQKLRIEFEEELSSNVIWHNKISKISIFITVAKYLNDAFSLKINIKELKHIILELEDENKQDEQRLYNKAFNDVVDYFYNNRDKFILKGEDLKSNTKGLYEVNLKSEITKIIIPSSIFETLILKLGYNNEKTLKAWKNKNVIKTDKDADRKNMKVVFGTVSTRCVVMRIKGGETLD